MTTPGRVHTCPRSRHPDWALVGNTSDEFLPCPWCLADHLAAVLSHMVVGWELHGLPDLAQHPDVVGVMARYRASKRGVSRD